MEAGPNEGAFRSRNGFHSATLGRPKTPFPPRIDRQPTTSFPSGRASDRVNQFIWQRFKRGDMFLTKRKSGRKKKEHLSHTSDDREENDLISVTSQL